MAKRTLAEAWIYDGVTYGPGEAELPDEVDKALGKRKAYEADETDPIAEALAAQGPQEGGSAGEETDDDSEADAVAKTSAPVGAAAAPKPTASTDGSTAKPTTASTSTGE